MNKKLVLIASGIGALSGGLATLALNKKTKNSNLTIEKAGNPDQIESKALAELENSKMVSEGSQFGVQYYNELKAERNKLK